MAARAMALAAARQQGWRSPSHYMRLARRSAERRGAVHEVAQNQLCEAEIALIEGNTARARRLCEEAKEQFALLGLAYFAERATMLAVQLHGTA